MNIGDFQTKFLGFPIAHNSKSVTYSSSQLLFCYFMPPTLVSVFLERHFVDLHKKTAVHRSLVFFRSV